MIFEATASIRINFAMQLFDKLKLERSKCYNLDVFNSFNLYDTKNAKE